MPWKLEGSAVDRWTVHWDVGMKGGISAVFLRLVVSQDRHARCFPTKERGRKRGIKMPFWYQLMGSINWLKCSFYGILPSKYGFKLS